MKTSFNKFLSANPRLTGVNLLKAWMKCLFVSSGTSTEAGKEKAFYLLSLRPYVPSEPLDGFLVLEVIFTYPWLKGHSKKLRGKYSWIKKNTKPDNDNKVKIFQDCLEVSGIVSNDSRFYKTVLEKRYGDNPGISFRITERDGFGSKRIPFD
jgi:Holliday junction resolvase RusA-like endonuclease